MPRTREKIIDVTQLTTDQRRALSVLVVNLVDGNNPDEIAVWVDNREDLSEALIKLRHEQL